MFVSLPEKSAVAGDATIKGQPQSAAGLPAEEEGLLAGLLAEEEAEAWDTFDKADWRRSFFAEVGWSPLARACVLWTESFPRSPEVYRTWIESFRRWAREIGGVVQVTSLFAGSDLIQHVSAVMSAFWRHCLGVNILFVWVVQAE